MAEMGLCDVIFDFKCEIPAYGGNPLARSVLSSRSAISLCAWGRLEICWGHPEHESDILVRMGKTLPGMRFVFPLRLGSRFTDRRPA